MEALKDHPILFTGAMVNAIQDGRKNQTRRLLYVPTKNAKNARFDRRYDFPRQLPPFGHAWTLSKWYSAKPGERIWVRESCRADELENGLDGVRYLADDAFIPIDNTEDAADNWIALNAYRQGNGLVVPSIHMPRWASRINLEITAVRVEKLQDISEADALAEGVTFSSPVKPGRTDRMAREAYADLWESINGPGSWDANPWVWVVDFKQVQS